MVVAVAVVSLQVWFGVIDIISILLRAATCLFLLVLLLVPSLLFSNHKPKAPEP